MSNSASANQDSSELSEYVAAVDTAIEAKRGGDLDAAQILFSRALQRLPKDNHYYPVCLSELAEIEESKEDWLRAIQHNLTLMIDQELRLGERDKATIATIDKTAALFEKVGRTDEAASLYERARSLSERSLWADQAQADTTAADTMAADMAAQAEAAQAQAETAEQKWDKATSMAMLQAFENAYAPYLQPKFEFGEEISLEELDRKLNLRGRLAKLRAIDDKEETPFEKLLARLRARLRRILRPLVKPFMEALRDRNSVLITLLIAAPLLILGALIFFAHTKAVPLEKLYQSMSHRYVSADGQKQFGLNSLAECEVTADAQRTKVGYRFYGGDVKDLLELAYSPLFQKQYWIRHLPDRCIDEDGGALYPDAGPAMRTVDSIGVISRGAAYYFLKEKNYPLDFKTLQSNLEEGEHRKFIFKQEYTGKSYTPDLQKLAFTADSEQSGDQFRQGILFRMRTGQLLDGEPKIEPGKIRCYSSLITLKRGPLQEFFVRGCDDKGNVIVGNSQGSGSFVGLEDGDELKPVKVKTYFDDQFKVKPRVVWLIEGDLTEFNQLCLRNTGWLTAVFSALALLVVALCMSKRDMMRPVMILLSILGFLVAIAYFAGQFLP